MKPVIWALSPACVIAAVFVVFTATQAASAQDRDPMLLHEGDGTTVRMHLQFGVNAVSERNLFWNFSDTIAPGSGFDPDADWLEVYVKPGLSFETALDTGPVLYGKLSGVASYTFGTDAYDFGDTGRATLEEAYLGLEAGLGAGRRSMFRSARAN